MKGCPKPDTDQCSSETPLKQYNAAYLFCNMPFNILCLAVLLSFETVGFVCLVGSFFHLPVIF